ncbi:choice-of-anchor L domain-containing protein, partial [Winogradskyella aurantiaca]|uniref:choice-of-anchor L domain-containing protein n=1 Tax=Winogradskyella aurantiaca TaxID=2219558 RepID=UPI000E1D485E
MCNFRADPRKVSVYELLGTMMNKNLALILLAFVAGLSLLAQELPMQNGMFNTCGPRTFTDSGGAANDYAPGEDFTMTICPDVADELIVLDFTEFSTQEGQDVLKIYDGDSTSAPLVGEYSGNSSPVLVIGNNATGCLTLHFSSSPSAETIGWEAQLECTPNCQDIEPIIDSTNPSANAEGIIVVSAGTFVDFNATANFSESSAGAIYTWDWGDGNTGFGQITGHQFNNGGSYNVILTVTDSNPIGCSESVSITVIVEDSIITANSPAFPESSFTPEELISQVLVTGGCAEVDNFEYAFNGTSDNLVEKSYGYFTRGGASDFPFEEGIVLSTGWVSEAGNASSPNLTMSRPLGIPGDIDLEDALGVVNSRDGTFIKFNFTPTAESISFRFIMASEEYSGTGTNFECDYSDGFAFLLRRLGSTSYTNLAVLPNGDEITIPNINNNPTCANNPEFFEGYNSNISIGGAPGTVTDTNFNGRTKVLTASSPVTPGVTYEIKLVVSDLGLDGLSDQAFDSAVFIEAGSFNLGGDLGDDITIANGNARCGGNDVELDTRAPGATHVWFKDGVEIPGETGSTLTVVEAGTYSVDVDFGGGCTTTDSIVVEFRESPVVEGEPQDLSNCSTGVTAVFNLESNTSLVLGGQDPADFLVTYHNSLNEARDGLNPITNSSSYDGANGEVIHVRIVDTDSGICFVLEDFTLEVFTEVTATPGVFAQCDNSLDGDDTNGFVEFDLTVMDPVVLGGLDPTDY